MDFWSKPQRFNRRLFSSHLERSSKCSSYQKSLQIYKKAPVHKNQMDKAPKREIEDESYEGYEMQIDFNELEKSTTKKVKANVQVNHFLLN